MEIQVTSLLYSDCNDSLQPTKTQVRLIRRPLSPSSTYALSPVADRSAFLLRSSSSSSESFYDFVVSLDSSFERGDITHQSPYRSQHR